MVIYVTETCWADLTI